MKLSKVCSDHLLAHLYEHIYFIYLDTAIRELGLFPIIDYSLNAFTVDGRITFEIETYRDIDMKQIFEHILGEFLANDIYVGIAIKQLESEYEKAIHVDDSEALTAALRSLNDIAWNSAQIHTADTNVLSVGDNITTKEISILCTYPAMPSKLKPLYRLFSGIVLNILVSDIADTYGSFVTNSSFETDKANNLVATVRSVEPVDRLEILNLYSETIHDIDTNQGFLRLITDLKNVQDMTNPPSSERAFKDTGILMYDQLWRDVATVDNMNALIELMSCDVPYA